MSADFWAGYISGALGIIVGNPLDLIKVRLQAGPKLTPQTPPPFLPSTDAAAAPALQHAATSTRPHTFRESLRGLPAPVLTYGALNALLFMSYNRSLAQLPTHQMPTSNISSQEQPGLQHPYWTHFLAGALAGLATFVISTPTELVKCRAQVASDVRSGHAGGSISQLQRPSTGATSSWTVLKHTLRTWGLPGLYEGGVITSVRDAVGYGFYFWTYEVGKNLWDAARYTGGEAKESSSKDEAVKVLLCGGLAGVATWASIFPLDVVKTRVQTQVQSQLQIVTCNSSARGEESVLLPKETRKGALRIALEAYRSEGVQVFFRGLTVCCVRAFVVNAAQWGAYEYLMGLLSK